MVRNRALSLIAVVILVSLLPGCGDDNGTGPSSSKNWSALTPLNNFANTATVFNGELIVGGAFTSAGGVAANYIARWDGNSWQPLGTGVIDDGIGIGRVSDVEVYNGNLIAAGYFTKAGGVVASNIAAWDGSSWAPLGAGVDSLGLLEGVYTMTTYNGNLVVGGDFREAGGSLVDHLAVWNGSEWSDLGGGVSNGAFPGTAVWSLGVYGGNLIVAGNFQKAGDVVVNNIAMWDGASWNTFGAGTSGGQVRSVVYEQAVFNGDLIIGGEFTMVDGEPASYIAAWDGSSWIPLGSGTNSLVQTVTVHGDRLIAGGTFTMAGGAGASNVAQWEGDSWSAMGSGLTGGSFGITLVADLVVLDGTLVAAGNFTQAGGGSAGHVAIWNE